MTMSKTEEMLNKKKSEIEHLNIPSDLEGRLSHALNKSKPKASFNKKWQVRVAVFMLAVLLTGYHVDTLAYYYKNLVGYDNVMNGTLKELNELGKGQMIGKSYTFENGATVTLDGIMLDDNQLLTFYTIKDPSGNVDQMDIHMNHEIKGLIGSHYMNSGHGEMNEEKTQMKWKTSFDTPYFFEKKLKCYFDLTQGNKTERGEIVFKLNRNKAMESMLKKQINKKISVDETYILFKSITASPTVTSIKGELQNIVGLAVDHIKDERFMPDTLEINLIANGKELTWLGGGMSTDMKGMQFHKEYDALPTDLKKLQIELVKFGANHNVDHRVKLHKQGENDPINILGQNIKIEKVEESHGETFITITTEDSVILSNVYLEGDGNAIELEETINSEIDKAINGIITHTRTLRFQGTGKEIVLVINRIKYDRIYNKVIDIPL